MAAVTLAQAVWRDITVQNAVCVQNAIIEHPDTVHQIVNSGDALIARSRSILATKFLDEITDSDVLVFVDGDITFSPADFAKVVEGARETGDIYGGLYVTRAREPHLASLPLREQAWAFQDTPERRPQELRYLATGFMAIPRAVLEDLWAGGFDDIDGGHCLHRYDLGTTGDRPIDFFRTFGIAEGEGSHWLSEDWAFCERWRQLGGKVWGDQSVMLGHQGAVTLTVEDLPQGEREDLPNVAALIERSRVQRHTFAKDEVDELVASLPADIAAFTEEPEILVRRMLPEGTAYLSALWEQRDEPIADWYLRDDVGHAYMLDLAHWHINGAAQHFYDAIEAHEGVALGEPRRILDYGAGIGTLAFMLARDGHEVDAYEPNPELRRFMFSRRGNLDGYNVPRIATKPVFSETSVGGPYQYGLIIATHVFEHLEGAEVDRVVAEFEASLAEGGVMFIENDWTVDEGHPQHADHSARFASAMAHQGFEHQGGGFWT